MHKNQRLASSVQSGEQGYSLTHLHSILPDNCYSVRLHIPDLADSASAVGEYIRCDRRSGLSPVGGRGRLPTSVLVRHPTSAKEEKEHIDDISDNFPWTTLGYGFYLVVKSASAFQIIHISGVRFSPPELHIRNLHITPDCLILAIDEFLKQKKIAHNDSRYTSNRHRPR